MCGRFLTPDESAFERYWGIEAPAGYARSFNLAPSQAAAVLRIDPEGALRADLLGWGFRPPWAKRAWINARSESVFKAKAFAAAARERRCLVPAIGWYEWRGSAAPKRPYLFHVEEFEPFAFPGIWTGRETEHGRERSFAILTRQAPAALAVYHRRMPVALDRAAGQEWLEPSTSPAAAERVLERALTELRVYPVSRYVNKPEHNDPRCMERVEPDAEDA